MMDGIALSVPQDCPLILETLQLTMSLIWDSEPEATFDPQ
jgi:hypothetical protein